MSKDPVCGMEVNPEEAAGTVEYKGETYYFCAPGCKNAFEKNPEQFLSSADADSHDHEHGHQGHHHH